MTLDHPFQYRFDQDGRLILEMSAELRGAVASGDWDQVKATLVEASPGIPVEERLAAAEQIADGRLFAEAMAWISHVVVSADWQETEPGVLRTSLGDGVEERLWAAIVYAAINDWPCR